MRLRQFVSLSAILLLALACSTDAFGQRITKKKKKDEKEASSFASHLWYGGGLILGFNSFNGASVLDLGISPMVGYKFYGPFSVGPRFSIDYSSYKFTGYKALGIVNTEAGVFLRARVFRGFFLQGELSNEWRQLPQETTSGLDKFKYNRFNQKLGLGYNFSNGEGGGGYEISLHYNFAVNSDQYAVYTSEQPINFRLNFTYNF
jgi:hypothetical protein